VSLAVCMRNASSPSASKILTFLDLLLLSGSSNTSAMSPFVGAKEGAFPCLLADGALCRRPGESAKAVAGASGKSVGVAGSAAERDDLSAAEALSKGTVMVIVVPDPSVEVRLMVPPMSSTS
jgi:hypothetical protein